MAAQPGKPLVSPRTKTNVVFQYAHSSQAAPTRPLPNLPPSPSPNATPRESDKRPPDREQSGQQQQRRPQTMRAPHHPDKYSGSSSSSSSHPQQNSSSSSSSSSSREEHVIPRSIRQQPEDGYSSAPEPQTRHHHAQSVGFRIKQVGGRRGPGRPGRGRAPRPPVTVAPKVPSRSKSPPPEHNARPDLRPQLSEPPSPHQRYQLYEPGPRGVQSQPPSSPDSHHAHSSTITNTIHITDIPTRSEPLLGGPLGPLDRRSKTDRVGPGRFENLHLPGRSPTRRDDESHRVRPKQRMGDSTKWKQGTLIGTGSFGRVYMAMNIETGELLAVKQIPTINMSETALGQLENEVSIMRTLTHPHIVALYGIQQTEEHLNILMEYVPGKSLDSIYKTFGPLSEDAVQKYLRQCVDGLAFAHENYVIHRDIKGKNILVDSRGIIKLADFGSAKVLDATIASELQPSIGYQYTPLWTAPEVMLGNYDEKVDVWSIGCVLIEICTAEAPWHECDFKNPFSALYHIGNTDAVPKWPETLSPVCQDFLRCCLVRDPRSRWSAQQLLDHEFLRNVYIPALHG